jgi:hypothetical protein
MFVLVTEFNFPLNSQTLKFDSILKIGFWSIFLQCERQIKADKEKKCKKIKTFLKIGSKK